MNTERRSAAIFPLAGWSIHLITAHGFYQGRGSPYRIEPDAACRVLGIP